MVKNLPKIREIQVWPLSREDPLEQGKATHSSIAWRILWAEEPGGLQSMGSQRVGHDTDKLFFMNLEIRGYNNKAMLFK